MSRFGELLREARTHARLTQDELAKRVDVHSTYVSKMETGVESPPSRKVALKLAEALGLNEKADRLKFLLTAGVVSDEDVQLVALVRVARATGHPPQNISSLSAIYHSPLDTSYQDVLAHRLAVLEKKLEVAEKSLHDAHEELRALGALATAMLSNEPCHASTPSLSRI